MNSETLDIVNQEYRDGCSAFERGQYRQAANHLAKASALVKRNSRLGGEIQIWLVTAYQAVGDRDKAIELCTQLRRHPDPDTSKQGRRLLYILEAPQLQARPEWLVKIPDLTALDDSGDRFRQGDADIRKPRTKRRRTQPEPPPFDPSEINTQDNRFIWVALGAIVLVLGGLAWLS